MTGLARLAQTALGTGTCASDFTCSPTSPASMAVAIGPGAVYQLENLEQSAISLLSPDSHSIMKQGILSDALNITVTAPSTVGYSQNVLIEVQYADSDSGNALLSYFNAAVPSSPYSGPGNNGQQQPTIRKGVVSIQAKYGTPATSGTQATPTPDAGWVGLFVISVAQGQTTVTSGNISIYPGAPFIPATLMQIPGFVQSDAWKYAGTSSNTGNAFNASLTPVPSTLTIGMGIRVKMSAGPTGASTLNINGLGATTIVKSGGATIAGGEWSIGDFVGFVYTGSNWQLNGLTSTGATLNDNEFWHFCSSPAGGTANALTAIASPVPPSFSAGMHVILYATTANTGGATLNLNALGIKNILNRDGSALVAGEITTTVPLWLMYDGTQFILMNPVIAPVGPFGTAIGQVLFQAAGASGQGASLGALGIYVGMTATATQLSAGTVPSTGLGQGAVNNAGGVSGSAIYWSSFAASANVVGSLSGTWQLVAFSLTSLTLGVSSTYIMVWQRIA